MGDQQGEGEREAVTAEGEKGHADARYCTRCVHHLLAALLPDPRAESSLQELLYLTLAVQRCHLAGIPQQCRQPCHLHHFQH